MIFLDLDEDESLKTKGIKKTIRFIKNNYVNLNNFDES